MPIRRALVVCQDNLLRNCPEITTDFISLGKSITPGRAHAPQSISDLTGKMILALSRLVAARYDLLILPAVDLSWPHDQSNFKMHLRAFTRVMFSLQEKINFLRLMDKKPLIAVLDRYDSTEIHPEMVRTVRADVYFKANYPAGPSAYPFKVQFLPYWVHEENYPDSVAEKKTDLFYAASMNSDSRRQVMTELSILAGKGISIDHARDRLPFPEFVTRMGNAILTLSPAGHGYHGFRHYEAMLMKSIPVLNAGQERLETDLIDGKTCLLYDAGREGDLTRCLTQALQDRERLIAWGRDLRGFALERHTATSVGRYLVAQMEALGRVPRQKSSP